MKTHRSVLAGLLPAVVIAAWLSSASAQAGTYVMRSCNVPGQRSAPMGPWNWMFTSAELFPNDECSTGGGFGLNAGTVSHGNVAAVHLGIPGEGPQNAITIRRIRLWMIARLSGGGGNLYVNFSSGNATQVMSQDLFGPPGGSTLTEPFVSPVLLADTQVAFVGLACSGGTGGPCTASSPNPLEIRGAEVTLHEASAPSGQLDGGSLLDGRPQAGVRAVSYTVSDGESGVAEVAVLLGNVVVATQDFRPSCTYAGLAACSTTKSGSASVDTRAVKDGDHPLTLRVTDAAGNRETIATATTIKVANGLSAGSPASNGSGAAAEARLVASFVGRRGSTASVRYHSGLTIRGRLSTTLGAPIARARVEVIERPAGFPGRTTTRTVTTRADGKFTYIVRRRGMSRKLQLNYRPSLDNPRIVASRLLRIRVSAAGTMRVNLRGVQVSYAGRVFSGPIPRGGKQVYLEGRAVGGRWTRFAVKRTDRAGRFTGDYRLRVHRPGVRLQFRMRIPPQTRYPYELGVGAPITRTVR